MHAVNEQTLKQVRSIDLEMPVSLQKPDVYVRPFSPYKLWDSRDP